MRYKILTLSLLLALVSLPVAQAMSAQAMPAEHDHGTMVMDCGHADPAHCIDFDTCVSQRLDRCERILILSHLPELLLRPPRNA